VDAELQSQSRVEEVVRRLHLDWGISEKSKGLSFKIAEFTSTSKTPDYKVVLTGPDKSKVANADGSVTMELPGFVVKNADGSIAAQGKTGQFRPQPDPAAPTRSRKAGRLSGCSNRSTDPSGVIGATGA
jgi:hypothetical protein